GPERALLEHVTDAAPARRQEGDVLAVHEDAPARHRQEARDRPQHVGLARLGRAEEREELAVAHVDADLVDARRAGAVALTRPPPDSRSSRGRAGSRPRTTTRTCRGTSRRAGCETRRASTREHAEPLGHRWADRRKSVHGTQPPGLPRSCPPLEDESSRVVRPRHWLSLVS